MQFTTSLTIFILSLTSLFIYNLNIFDNFLLLNNEYVPGTTFLIQKKHS